MIKRALIALLLFYAVPSLAVLSISVCGHSSHNCAPCVGNACAPSSGSGSAYGSFGVGDQLPMVEVVNPIGDDSKSVRIPTVDLTEEQPEPPDVPQTTVPVSTYTFNQTCNDAFASSNKPCYTDGSYWYVDTVGGVTQTDNGANRYCSGTMARSRYYYAGGTGCGSSQHYVGQSNYPMSATLTGTATQSCPSGYEQSGANCVVVDPREAEPDGNIDYTRSGGSYSPASSNDADGNVDTVGSSGGTIQASGYTPDETGAYTVPTIITINSSGSGSGSEIIITRQVGGVVHQTTYGVGSNGTVQSVSQGSASGTVSVGSNGAGSVGSNPGVSDPGGGTGLEPMQFPSDYATSGKQDLANLLLTDIKDKLSNSDEVGDPTLPETMPGFGETFAPLLSWQLPGHSSQCPTGSFVWNGSTYTLDTHCQLVQDHWGMLQTVMAVVWTIAALWIVLRA